MAAGYVRITTTGGGNLALFDITACFISLIPTNLSVRKNILHFRSAERADSSNLSSHTIKHKNTPPEGGPIKQYNNVFGEAA